MFGLIVVLLGIILVGYLIVKKYYAPWSLLLVGLVLLLIVGIFTDTVNSRTRANGVLTGANA